MMTGAVKNRTKQLGLAELRFNFPNWADDMNQNMRIIDSAFSVFKVAVSGIWENNKSYTKGQIVFDTDTNALYRVNTSHVSAATGTFAQDRAARPLNWVSYDISINYRGQWTANTSYNQNETMYLGNVWAISTRAYISSNNFNTDITNGNLAVITDFTSVITQTNAARDAAIAAQTAAQTAQTASQTNRDAAAASATNAATSATNSQNSATSSQNSATASQNSATASKNDADRSTTQANNSAASATAANASQLAAKTSETNSFNSANLADKWANNPYNTEVTTGKYSAFHYSEVTRLLISSTQTPLQSNVFVKANSSLPAFVKTGNGTISVRAGTYIGVNNQVFNFTSDTAISMPTLTAGTDIIFWIRPDGQVVGSLNYTSPPVAGARRIGGAHYAVGGNATGISTGGNTTPQFNPYSIWDIKFRPACSDPRGMTLVGGGFWVDIYHLGVNHHIDGTSKYGTTIADSGSPPKIPLVLGGDGTATYSGFIWYDAQEVLAAYGKRSLSYNEFIAAAYGVKEGISIGTDPVTNIYSAAYNSLWGVNLASGCAWYFGRFHFYTNNNVTAVTTSNVGRGFISEQGSNSMSCIVFGGYWGSNTAAGSRSLLSQLDIKVNDPSVGARGSCDHLELL